MATLKNAEFAIIDPDKFIDYSLSPCHEDGKHKARVFKSALGYDATNYKGLIVQIRRAILVHEAVCRGDDEYGTSWRVDVPIKGPTGSAIVRTGWFYDRGCDVPRLTTAIVR
jgi:hypothetical protein